MDRKRREKGRNYSIREKNILLSIVDKYKDKIETKQTDSMSNYTKSEIWRAVEKEFNCKVGENDARNAEQLKTLYKNLKRRKKATGSIINKEESYLENVFIHEENSKHMHQLAPEDMIKAEPSMYGEEEYTELELFPEESTPTNSMESYKDMYFRKKIELLDLEIKYKNDQVQYLEIEHKKTMAIKTLEEQLLLQKLSNS